MDKKLVKGQKQLSGVCSGIANYLNIDVTLVRIIYACLTLFSACFPGVVLYIILALLMPEN